MGTLASMSVSIVSRGRLWGLISCHDHQPHYLPFQTRVACEHLGRLLSLQIQAQEDNAESAQRLALHQRVLRLVALMAETDGTLQRLVSPDLDIQELAAASGAAVVLNDSCWTTGDTPPPDQVRELAHWISRAAKTCSARTVSPSTIRRARRCCRGARACWRCRSPGPPPR